MVLPIRIYIHINMKALVDVLIYLDCFRNIDVFLQGLYYLQISISKDAVPYYIDSKPAPNKFHNLYPNQILDNAYTTKIFILKYAEEIVKILETVVFRVELDPSLYEPETLIMQVDLMFTDLKGDLSSNSIQNYFNSPPEESLFSKVGECCFTIDSALQSITQVVFVTFMNTFSSSLMSVICIYPANYKIPEDYIEDLFPDSADLILEQKIDKIYDTYVLPLGLGCNKLQKLLGVNMSPALALPLLSQSDIEPDYICKVIHRKLFSKCIHTKDKREVSKAIIQEIQEAAAHILRIKHKLLELFMTKPESILNTLLKEYITLMDDRWGENIIQEHVYDKINIISDIKAYDENIQTAAVIKSSNNFLNLDYFRILDNKLFRDPDQNTILFEITYSAEKVESPSICTVFNRVDKSRHLIILAHGYLGSFVDVKMLQDTISNIYPKGLFLLSRANEGFTEGSLLDMGIRLSEEVKSFISSSNILIEKITFIGHSLGGLIIRASLPYLSEFQNRFYSYISLACPHLGCLNNESILIDAGMWILCKIKQSILLNQLNLDDNKDKRHSVVFNLSKDKGLEWFKKVYFFSSVQDRYVPFHSARAEVGSSIFNGDTLEYEMASNIVSQITGSFHRINTIFYMDGLGVGTLIGRTAHVMFLDNLQFLNILVFKYIL
jgi:Putative serine esterase (DUF676)